MNRREKILLGLAALLALMALWKYRPWDADSAPAQAAERRQAAVQKAVQSLVPLQTDRLTEPRPQYKKVFRNPFYFGQPPAPVPGPEQLAVLQRSAEEEHLRLVERERQRTEAARAMPAPMPTSPLFEFPFVGYVGPPGDEIAIFRDGKEFLYARRGEIIKERFEVVDIGYESVEIKFRATGETHRYPLTSAGGTRPR
jgi:hypothetical protein